MPDPFGGVDPFDAGNEATGVTQSTAGPGAGATIAAVEVGDTVTDGNDGGDDATDGAAHDRSSSSPIGPASPTLANWAQLVSENVRSFVLWIYNTTLLVMTFVSSVCYSYVVPREPQH